MFTGSAFYMVGLVSQRLASFVVVPIVTSHLIPEEYGVMDLLEQVGVVVSVLLGLNFSSALGFFFFADGADKARVVGTTLLGSLLIGTLAGSLGVLFAPQLGQLVFHSPAFDSYIRLVFFFIPLGFLLESCLAWLRAEDRMPLYTSVVLLRLAIAVGGTVLLVASFELKILGVLLSSNVAIVIVALLCTAAAFRSYRLVFDRDLFFKMMKFAMPMTLSALALFFIHFGDRFFLPRYRPLEELGIYAIAYKVGMLISVIQNSFGNYWAAQVYQIVKRPDAQSVFARSLTYMTAAMAFCGLGLLVEARPMLILLTTPEYYSAIAIIPIILAAYFIRSFGDFFRFVFLAQGVPLYDAACNWITAATAFASYLILIPRYGIQGAAWATLLTFAIAAAVSMIWVYRVWHYKIEGLRLAKVALATAGVAGVHFALPVVSVPILVLRGAGLLIFWCIALIAMRLPSPGERALLQTIPQRLQKLLA
jgi:O-antigen/teichoic acid export membrane protein